MKKRLHRLLLVFTICVAMLTLTACGGGDGSIDGNGGIGDAEINEEIRAVYASYVEYAKEQNKTPLDYEEWLESLRGETGASGADGLTPYIGTNGNWWIGDTDTGVPATGAEGKPGADGKPGEDGKDGVDGKPGEDGEDGKDGVGIASIALVSSDKNVDTYKITYTDGKTTTFTVTNGINGTAGADGKDGVGITDAEVNENGELVLSLSNGSTLNLGCVIGEKGEAGAPGQNGADGEDGKDGADGEDGKDGADGEDGVGIKDVAINAENKLFITLTNGTVIDLGNIKGADGKDGVDGEDGKDGADGKDGISITKSEINEDGELVFTFSDGKTVNVGKVVGTDGINGSNGTDGEDGKDGADGVGIQSVKIDDNGNLVITLTNGTVIDLGNIKGADGKDGVDGEDGVSVIKSEINADGELVLYYSNGTSTNLGKVVGTDGTNGSNGTDGENGKDGADGVGIQTVKIDDNGNLVITLTNGTVIDLGNIMGADGKDGEDGISVIKSEINENGELVLYYSNGTSTNLGKVVGTDGTNGSNGVDGEDGKDGADGVGIQSVKIDDNGNLVITLTNGTVIDLGNIKGADGKDGIDGEDGADGKDGISITKSEINQNGELVFTFSDGSTVNVGKVVGTDGTNGSNGTDGEDGKDGIDGVGIDRVIINANGELVITYTNDVSVNCGKVNGTNGESAYEIYIKNHPEYIGTEEKWIEDLVNGQLVTLKVTVTYNLEGGNIDGKTTYSEQIAKGSNITLPIPEKFGYEFIGWYTGDSVNDGQFYNDTCVSKDIVLTAKWQVATDVYYVSYIANGGKAIAPQQYKEGDKILSMPRTSRVNYVFLGWYSDKELTVAVSLPITVTEDIVVYAKWEKIVTEEDSALITFETNGGTEMAGQIVMKGQPLSYIASPTKLDYNFAGWYLNEELTTAVTYPFCVTEDVKLYAKWEVSSPISGLTFSLQNKTYYRITGYTGTSTRIKLPSTYAGLPVLEIGEKAFQGNKTITEVTIPSGITTIGKYAFQNCTNLKRVYFKQTDVAISAYMFSGCTSLKEIDFSAVATIGDYAFQNCTALYNVYLPSNVQSLGAYAFAASGITNLTFDVNSILETIDSAFFDCDYLSEVRLPASVQTLGIKAFAHCEGLKSVVLNEGLVSTGGLYNTLGKTEYYDDTYESKDCYGSFGGCTNLTTINIPSTMVSIGPATFIGCINLTNLQFPTLPKLTTIENGAFAGCSSLNITTLPSTTKTIGVYAFYLCNSIKQMTLPTELSNLGDYAFNSCGGLEQLYVNKELTTIGAYAFTGCASLKVLTFDSNAKLTHIESAFYNCDSLSEVRLPSSMRTLGMFAFACCDGLKTVVLNEGLVSTGGLYNSLGKTEYYDGTYESKDCYGSFGGCTNLTTINIPSTMVSIGPATFIGCINLKNVNTASAINLTTIGAGAFAGCSALEAFVIPGSVATVGAYAFYSCTKLTIYSYQSQAPASWDANWNKSSCTVVWNY